MRAPLLFLCLLMLAAGAPVGAAEQALKVAAAADLRFALEEISKRYEKAHPEAKVELSFGSSGRFRTQILAGAPFDLFLSADAENAEAVAKAGRGAAPVFPYAKGRLSLWVKKDSALKLDASLEALKDSSIQRLAIGNPAHAPYGRIAEAALRKAGLWPAVEKKLVRGDSIAQAAQFVESGAADIGLVATSLAEAPALKEKGRSVAVNESLYAPLNQSGLVLKGPAEKAARAFAQYLVSAEGKFVLLSFGLSPL